MWIETILSVRDYILQTNQERNILTLLQCNTFIKMYQNRLYYHLEPLAQEKSFISKANVKFRKNDDYVLYLNIFYSTLFTSKKCFQF